MFAREAKTQPPALPPTTLLSKGFQTMSKAVPLPLGDRWGE